MRRELFHPMDKDNKDSTPLFENLTAIAARAWIDELLDPKKATFQYLSESGSDYCWSHCSDEVKTALMGKMAVNDRAESSFAGVTAQIQDYGWIGLANSAAISDMGRNGFLNRPLTKTEKPPACVPQRKAMPVLGQVTSAVKEIDRKRKEDTDGF
jgi:hypothetical protein